MAVDRSQSDIHSENGTEMYGEISLTRGRLHEQIADRIQDMIASQRLQPGDKLPNERDLARMLNVSRPTIREAMRLLEHRGLVSRKPGGGTYLIHMGTDAVAESLDRFFWIKDCSYEDLMQLREMVEPNAAALAALHATPDQLSTMQDKLSEIDSAFQSADPRRLARADAMFHVAIAHASGNQLLAAVIAGIDHLVRKWNEITSTEILDRSASTSHHPIMVAIQDREPDRAREAMSEHIRLSRKVYERTSRARAR